MNQPTNSAGEPDKSDDKNDATSDDKSEGKAVIGSSVKVSGDISGKENLRINGAVEGTIDFPENDVIIGKSGHVNANVSAKNICVEGEVKGELRGGEQVVIKPSGRVTGDIRAPRVILHDGCQFKGSVDMDDKIGMGGDSRSAAAKLAGVKPLGHTPLFGQKTPDNVGSRKP